MIKKVWYSTLLEKPGEKKQLQKEEERYIEAYFNRIDLEANRKRRILTNFILPHLSTR